jgi:hypothetical protein
MADRPRFQDLFPWSRLKVGARRVAVATLGGLALGGTAPAAESVRPSQAVVVRDREKRPWLAKLVLALPSQFTTMAMHRSHRSHSSHRSHYSSRTSPTPTPAPSRREPPASQPSRVVVPPVEAVSDLPFEAEEIRRAIVTITAVDLEAMTIRARDEFDTTFLFHFREKSRFRRLQPIDTAVTFASLLARSDFPLTIGDKVTIDWAADTEKQQRVLVQAIVQ